MAQTKTKRSSRTRKAGHSPIPQGPGSSGAVCGHSGCGVNCRVRYCGPTSHPRDHHIQMAAHGTKHIWAASIVAGLAVVLTGSIAFSGAQAESATRVTTLQQAVSVLSGRLDAIDRKLNQILERLPERAPSDDSAVTPTPTRPQPTRELSCPATCEKTVLECRLKAANDRDSIKGCAVEFTACVRACAPSDSSARDAAGNAPPGTE